MRTIVDGTTKTAALCARQWFDWQKPAWAPELPLRMKDRELLENDAEHQRRLVGLFGSSLRAQEWDYRTHPPFAAYCRGLMAYPAAGDELRQDWELLREFPPQPLAGLADGDRTWRTAEQIAEHRQGAAYCLEMETRVIAGKEYMGFDQWRREQLPIFVGLCC